MMKKSLSACLLSSALLVGCGNTNEADVEGCEHLKEGPGVSVTATASASGAPAVSNDHKRYDITLPEASGSSGNAGSVSFSVSETSHYAFFLGADVNLAIASTTGSSSVAFESATKSSEVCGEIKGRYVAELLVGTYTLTFGPTSQSSVSLVIEEEGAEHEH